MSFKSYFWNENRLADEKVKSALNMLSSAGSTDKEKVDSFKFLLLKDNTQSQGIAFDQYFYKNSQARFGENNIFSQFADTIVQKAREQLKHPPFSGTTASGAPIQGANYASALNILALLGNEIDVALISKILLNSKDESVIWSGCMAASTCLKDSKEAYPQLFKVLTGYINQKQLSETTKIEAIDALAASSRKEVEVVLADAVTTAKFPVNVYAAIRLGERDMLKYRELLENLVGSLPQNAPYPASDLIEMLAEGY